MLLSVLESDLIQVNMGVPETVPERVPFLGSGQSPKQSVTLADGRTIALTALSMGNPHAVLLLDAPPTDAMVAELGPMLESHPDFPERVNVGFLFIEQPDRAQLRVYERGVGETLACGSGACAALVAGRLHGRLAETATLNLLGGPLQLTWSGAGHPVIMTGPATFVYEGFIDLERN
jgi:diaminopimelate epimerase